MKYKHVHKIKTNQWQKSREERVYNILREFKHVNPFRIDANLRTHVPIPMFYARLNSFKGSI